MSNTGVNAGAAGTVARLNAFTSTKRSRECTNCKDKGFPIYDPHSGDELCRECGLILEARVMSEEQEWRSFSNTDGGSGNDRNRVGGVNDAWMEESVQGTSMMGGDKKYNRLSQTHELATSASSQDRQLKTAFGNLRLITDHFALKENALERCKEIVKDLQTAGNLKNRTGVTYMLSVVYLSCREEGLAMSLKDFTSFDRTIQERELGKAVNRIKKLLPQKNLNPVMYASAELVSKFSKALSLGPTIVSLAESVARNAEMGKKTTCNKPQTIAGAAIIISSQLHNISTSPAEVSQAARSGYQLLVKTYNELLPFIKTLVPVNFLPLNSGGYNALKPLS